MACQTVFGMVAKPTTDLPEGDQVVKLEVGENSLEQVRINLRIEGDVSLGRARTRRRCRGGRGVACRGCWHGVLPWDRVEARCRRMGMVVTWG